MAELKTKPNAASVEKFLDSVVDEQRRADCRELLALMSKLTGEKASMWGASIVGFGSYHYKYASGREGDWFLTGFSPRKQDLTLYIMSGFPKFEPLLAKLGKFKHGVSCLYLKRLSDVDRKVLSQLIEASVRHLRATQKA
jgi:hypothetical protein